MEREKLGGRMYMGRPFKGSSTKLPKKNSQILAPPKQNLGLSNQFSASVDDPALPSGREQGAELLYGNAVSCNGPEEPGFLNLGNRVSINLDFKSKKELSNLKVRLRSELMLVRDYMKRIEGYGGSKLPVIDNGAHDGRLKRVHSDVGSVDGSESRSFKPFAMPEGKIRGVLAGNAGKGMRVPKMAQLQRNSDFNPSEDKGYLLTQLKKSKVNAKKNAEVSMSIFGIQNSSSKVFRSCSSLLTKLLKCRGGHVFSKPVDAIGLGLHDYFTVIKHPMDLGTVRSRLSKNWYMTPEEFAEDVRLTFRNAMTYNMEGHDIHTLAKNFLKMFEDKWVDIVADYACQLGSSASLEADLYTAVPTPAPAVVRSPLVAPEPPPRVTTPLPPPPSASTPPTVSTLLDTALVADVSEPVLDAITPGAKGTNVTASGKIRLAKPKAKDLHKRDMTLEEKQKLSTSLQNLPSEKLEGVLRIIKKRNPSLCQSDDEIEVDIDTVDTETLWELDRFVIYYKKALSKMKRSAQSTQTGMVVEPASHEKNGADFGIEGIEGGKESGPDEKNDLSLSSNEGEKEGGNASVSDGSSSSSSGSGSSSSESDSDSSSS